MLVSVIHLHESAIGVHRSPPFWTFLPPPTPSRQIFYHLSHQGSRWWNSIQIKRSGNQEADGMGSQSEGADLSRRRWMSQPPREREFTFPLLFCPRCMRWGPPTKWGWIFFFATADLSFGLQDLWNFVAAHGIFSCGMQTLSCSMWALVPWPGIEPGPPVLRAWSLSHGTTREVSGERECTDSNISVIHRCPHRCP